MRPRFLNSLNPCFPSHFRTHQPCWFTPTDIVVRRASESWTWATGNRQQPSMENDQPWSDWCSGNYWSTVRYLLSCANYNNTWTSYWGPDIVCDYNSIVLSSAEPIPVADVATAVQNSFKGKPPDQSSIDSVLRVGIQCYQNFKCILKTVTPGSDGGYQ